MGQAVKKTPDGPGRNGYTYRPQFGVVVICADEQAQQTAYNDLVCRGYKCKVVVV